MIEELSDLEHESWSSWMQHLFSKGKFNEDGTFTINKESVKRWVRQMNTQYEDLSEKEKESDRIEVRKFMNVIDFWIK